MWLGKLKSQHSEKLKIFIPATTLKNKCRYKCSHSYLFIGRRFGTRFVSPLVHNKRAGIWQLLYVNRWTLEGIACYHPLWDKLEVQLSSTTSLTTIFIYFAVVHINAHYDVAQSLEATRWTKLVTGPLNGKCRNLRKKHGLTGQNKDFSCDNIVD